METIYETRIKFIARNNEVSNDLISNVFSYYGVASRIQSEHELPEYLRFWQDDF